MGLFSSTEFTSLDDLLVDQLRDLYDAETRLVTALPKMVEAAASPDLKTAFRNHLAETKQHVTRLEQAFEMLNADVKAETCDAMKGLLKEGDKVIAGSGDAHVRDAALIAAAQRVEHYEMAGYGSARNFAQQVGREDVAALLQQTLDEEGNADKKLTQIADSSVNVRAAHA
ncbi:MAG: ferritin-like domain-containing protein [Planctomycetaceae bacterium]